MAACRPSLVAMRWPMALVLVVLVLVMAPSSSNSLSTLNFGVFPQEGGSSTSLAPTLTYLSQVMVRHQILSRAPFRTARRGWIARVQGAVKRVLQFVLFSLSIPFSLF